MIAWHAVILAIGLNASVAALVAREPWDTCESYTPMPGDHHKPFEIGCWGDDGKELHGFFTYAARRYPGDLPPARLHGKRDAEWFRPNVTFQISRTWDGPWKTIGRLRVGDDVFTVDTAKGGSGLQVQLEAFRPYLRKFQCGRVVLESGEAATIDLDNLLPQKERPKRHE
jgi:hypothetical protein